jgi:hypothetical protein
LRIILCVPLSPNKKGQRSNKSKKPLHHRHFIRDEQLEQAQYPSKEFLHEQIFRTTPYFKPNVLWHLEVIEGA